MVLERLARMIRRRKPRLRAPSSDPRDKAKVRRRQDDVESRLSLLEAEGRVMRRDQ